MTDECRVGCAAHLGQVTVASCSRQPQRDARGNPNGGTHIMNDGTVFLRLLRIMEPDYIKLTRHSNQQLQTQVDAQLASNPEFAFVCTEYCAHNNRDINKTYTPVPRPVPKYGETSC